MKSNEINQKNKTLYALPKISLTSIKDYELLDYVLSFKNLSFYFNLEDDELDLIFIDRDNGFGFIGINNFEEISELIKIENERSVSANESIENGVSVESHYLYVFRDFKVIKKFAIINEESELEEWYFDIVLYLKCLKTRRLMYVLLELR